jgi:hypothetical protein
MKFAELESIAQGMPPERVDPSLRELMRDPRFGAVLRLIRDHRGQLVLGGASPSVAGSSAAGTIMAHYFGGVDALLTIESRLFAICEEGVTHPYA